VAALGIALVAQALVTRPGSTRHTYGLRRAEALGAQVNALLLIAASIWIFIEAGRRLGTTETIDGAGVVALGSIALTVNVVSALLLARVRGGDLNLRGAFLHMTADAAGSAGAVAAGIAVIAFDVTWVDAVAVDPHRCARHRVGVGSAARHDERPPRGGTARPGPRRRRGCARPRSRG
jgi:cobalt-zinc-cadmium efflux system protein